MARPGLDVGVDPNSLGVVPNTRVSKNNPVDINIYTFESVKHPGLYAMGPLVGDNFVRFLQVWSLTQLCSVDFSQSRIGVNECVFYKRTIKVCVSCC